MWVETHLLEYPGAERVDDYIYTGYQTFDQSDAGGGFGVHGNGGLSAGELVGGGWGWGGSIRIVGAGGGAVDAEDCGAVVGEEEACKGTWTPLAR